ncbi:cytidylate kinase [Thiopseudomonas alkaliphila]|uniref:Cytidylate kinase n=1 Tax=Thiopseudomonas alkaliphila TaxID=1697053 RepID=A0A0K1XBP4_9GAMM|nr:(d)CMP kinase [Thiopseudomonas alkaliphila]AKX58756.1 cytidylate kinase [Thiopseudomonas alkaliphila]
MNSAVSAAPVITIDGPGGSGKGTVAGILAKKLGWHLLDSGALYRLLALAASQQQLAFSANEQLLALAKNLPVQFLQDQVLLAGEDVSLTIRTEQVGGLASQVAAIPEVRTALLQRQYDFRQPPGLVCDGRDMGTVVFPNAELKVFLTASVEERAQRRYLQLKAKGEEVKLASLLQEIRERDERDMGRATAPLKPAPDALILDSTQLSIEQVVQRILDQVAERHLV